MLNIDDASIGYSQEGANNLKQELKTQYLDSTIDQLNSNFHELEESIDEIWVGESADAFKENMRADVDDTINAIQELNEAIAAEIDNTVNKMSQADAGLVPRRGVLTPESFNARSGVPLDNIPMGPSKAPNPEKRWSDRESWIDPNPTPNSNPARPLSPDMLPPELR